MSMFGSQIDELRELAGDGSIEWVTCSIRASVLHDAADTICELRDDLQRANAENARLRDENDCVGMAAYELGRKSMADKNAKLREMIADMWRSAMMYCDFAERCAFADEFVDRMRELEIEVNG